MIDAVGYPAKGTDGLKDVRRSRVEVKAPGVYSVTWVQEPV